MSVVYVEELWSGRSGEDGIERKRNYTRAFEVRTSSNSDDASVAGGTSLLPRNGEPYPFDARAYMIKIRPTQNDADPTLWTVLCEYSTELPFKQARETQSIDPETGDSQESPVGRDRTGYSENPLDRSPVYSIEYETQEEIVTHDWQGFSILNCADEPYDPPLTDHVSYAIVTIEKNLAQVKFDWLDTFVNSVNNAKWNGRAIRTAWMMNIGYGPPLSENGVNFWKVKFRVKLNPKTWDRFVLECGYNQVVASGPSFTMKPCNIQIDPAGRGGARTPRLDNKRDPSNLQFLGTYPNGKKPEFPDYIPGATYITFKADPTAPFGFVGPGTTDGSGNWIGTGRGQQIPDNKLFTSQYTRWRVKPEKNFKLLGL